MPKIIIIHTRVVCNDCRGKKMCGNDFRMKKRTRMRRRPSWRHCWPRERRSWQKCNENPPRQFSLHFRDTFLRKTIQILGIEKFEKPPVTHPPRDQQVPDLPTNPASSFKIKGINVNYHVHPQWALSFSLSISCTYKMILPFSRIVA